MQKANTHQPVLTEGYVKEFYDEGLKSFEDEYTQSRWFSSVKSMFDYRQTKYAFLSAVGHESHSRGLEVGPGDGVWTKTIANRIEDLELLDQSEEMLKRAKRVLSEYPHITYTTANVADHAFRTGHYDFLFSVRCLEYVRDKDSVIKKFYDALMPGGKFVLITKNPHYWSQGGRQETLLHSEQMGKEELVSLLKKHGFIIDAVYPATMRWKAKHVFFRGVFWLLHRVAALSKGQIYLPWITDMSTESYTYVARKDRFS